MHTDTYLGTLPCLCLSMCVCCCCVSLLFLCTTLHLYVSLSRFVVCIDSCVWMSLSTSLLRLHCRPRVMSFVLHVLLSCLCAPSRCVLCIGVYVLCRHVLCGCMYVNIVIHAGAH